jgi:hypothetical protein
MSIDINLAKNKLICTVTGITVSVAPKVFDQRAIKYGSAENLRLNYISALGRKLLCTGKTVQEIRLEYNVTNAVPLPSEEIVKKYIKWARFRTPKNNLKTQDISKSNEQQTL